MPKVCLGKRLVKAAFVLFIASVIAGCAAKTPPPEGKYTSWTNELADERRSNVSTDKIILPLVATWTKDIAAFRFINRFPPAESSSPVLVSGVLYTGSEAGKVYAVELATGRVKWSFDAEYPIEGAVAVDAGRVCFGAADGIFRCLDIAAGGEAWRFQAKSSITSSPLIKDGRVWFTSSDDRLYALSIDKGEKAWVYTRGTYQTVAPRVSGSSAFFEDKLYQLFSDGYLVALSADTGKELWAVRVISNFTSAVATRRVPLVHNGKVFIIDEKNTIASFDAMTGQNLAHYDAVAAYDFVIVNDTTLITAGSDSVVAIDMLSGAIVWKKELTHKPISSISASGDYLFILSNFNKSFLDISYFESAKGHIEALRLSNGEAVWKDELESTVTARPSEAFGYAALTLDEGTVRVYVPQKP